MSNSNYFKGSSLVYYDLHSISERDVKPWLTDYLTSDYFSLVDTKGRFALDKNHLCEGFFIPIVISGKKPKRNYCYSNKELARKIANRIEIEHFRSSEEAAWEIESILNKKDFTDTIIGSYSHDNCPIVDFDYPDNDTKPYITLYYNNFECETDEEFKAALSNCLSHEYFHFVHNRWIGSDFFKPRRGLAAKQRNSVTESLADFFSFVYSLSRCRDSFDKTDSHLKYAEYRLELWKERVGSNWPYACAYCYFFNHIGWPVSYSSDYREYLNNGCVEKFNMVMDVSKDNFAKAYKLLDVPNTFI